MTKGDSDCLIKVKIENSSNRREGGGGGFGTLQADR